MNEATERIRPGLRERSRTSIRARLTYSHIAAVTASTLVYAAGGFVLLVVLLYLQGYTPRGMVNLVPQFLAMTAFVLLQIALITVCGMVVAAIVSRVVSRSMLQQIVALEQGSTAMEAGDFSRPVPIITDDELGDLAGRFNEFAARLDISHDLRTPITVIRGHIEAQLRSDPAQDLPASDSFAAIDREIVTLSRLIEDLFTLSRIEEGVLPLSSAPVSLGDLVTTSVASLRAYALSTARVSVNAEVPEHLPRALADPTRVTQIINNLLHNAIRHTPAGGIVLVQVKTSQMGELHVTVRDTGVGIPPEVLNRIFERYYRGEEIGEKGGAGLGLNIVKQLVELQGGRAWIESTVGEGTAVSFTLPAERAAKIAPAA
jgi:signal transduction histidine kinase